MNLNKVFIIGRLTADPKLRTTPSGQSVATFAVATNRTWMNKQNEKQEEVQYHNIVVWGRQAEVANQFLKKGGVVMIEGRIQTRSWQDKQGQKQYMTEIISERMQLGPRSGDFSSSRSGSTSGSERDRSDGSSFKDEGKEEELPEIDIEAGEIRAEDIPF